MEWLNQLVDQSAPALWFLSSGVFLLVWYLAIRAKHCPGINEAVLEIHRRRALSGDISEEELAGIRRRLSKR